MKGKRFISSAVILIYLLFIPLNSYARVVQEAEMILRTAGRNKVVAGAAKMGAGYAAARLALGFNVVGALVTIGLVAYDLYNRFGDNTQGAVTLVNPTVSTLTSNSYTISRMWGKATTLSCFITSYTHNWNTIPNCQSYKQIGRGFDMLALEPTLLLCQ